MVTACGTLKTVMLPASSSTSCRSIISIIGGSLGAGECATPQRPASGNSAQTVCPRQASNYLR